MIKNKKSLIEYLKKNKGNVIKVQPEKYYLGTFYLDKIYLVYYEGSDLILYKEIINSSNSNFSMKTVNYEISEDKKEKFLNTWIENFKNSIKFNKGIGEEEKKEVINNINNCFNMQKENYFNFELNNTVRCELPPANKIIFNDKYIQINNSKYFI